jgi:DNA-binding NtrC family response regulator
MRLRALKFVISSGGVKALQSELDADSRSLARLKSQGLYGAYVVANQDLESLRGLKESVVDRRQKNKAKELSRLLLGHALIPIISGDYTAAGRLAQGVESLLRHASKKQDKNIYIIGADETIFKKLWEDAATRTADKKTASPRRKQQSYASESSAAEPISSELLLGLLPQCDIPEDLERSYVGDSIEIQLVRHLVMRAAGHDRPVLILGDTGTGKEIVARSIHKYSDRRSERFVAVNCGAIPSELFESELFGNPRGAFTGAVYDKQGLWVSAGRGTLFLDEIGDLSLDHQVKILRALEEKKVRRIGESVERAAEARVVAATNRDLFSMVQRGQFREDLYYRLRVFLIHTPALRNHPQDIPQLAQAIWRKVTGDASSRLPDDLTAALTSYRWPGNVREVKSVLMGIYTLFGKEGIGVEHLDAVFKLQGQAAAASLATDEEQEISLHRVECLRHLRRVDEVIRACRVTLGPITGEAEAGAKAIDSMRSSLGHRLSELELLCLRPLLFHRELTFSVIYRLKGKLAYLHSLIASDIRMARSYWKDELDDEYRVALSAVFREVEQLTGGR